MIPKDQMIISMQELKNRGFTHYKINQMVHEGVLEKLNKKYYKNGTYQGEESEFYYANAVAPEGVVCLLSAASYYRLSTERLDAIDIAIPRKSKVSTLPKWPEFKVNYYTDERFDMGIELISEGTNCFRIYDMEKTVVDIVSYREKIGIGETKEVLTSYLRRKDRNLNRLMRYAKALKCADVLEKYLEVLV